MKRIAQSLKRLGPWPVAMGLSTVVVLGTAGLVLPPLYQSGQPQNTVAPTSETLGAIAPLASLTPQQRAPRLAQLVERGNGQEKVRAQYVLAADLIQQQQGQPALQHLEGLERRYPLLAAEVAVLQAQAQALTGEEQQAQKTWQRLLKDHPQDPAAAEALYALGPTQPQYWDRLLTEFPAHPRAVEVAVLRLQANPNQPQLLLLIAKHGLHLEDYTTYLDRLTQKPPPSLQPTDWQAIAFGYWEKQTYKEAGLAYSKAPPTARNGYRAARGLQLGGEKVQAIAAYRQLIQAYPQAQETPTALIKLARITDPIEAMALLEQAVQLSQTQQRPHLAGEAVLAQLRLLRKQGNGVAATQVQQQLLAQYGMTASAAEWRWEQAREQAQAQNWTAAKKWAMAIASENSDSNEAPAALFWAGKWANRLGDTPTQKKAFQQLWQTRPDSYYAWRAAALSGWPVGNFTTVRQFQPQVQLPSHRLELAAGSAALKELYHLGQDQTAWEQWQWEFRNRQDPTFEDQLTDGLVRSNVGEYLDGIYMLTDLEWRLQDEPEKQEQYQVWHQDQGYGYALYPLAFQQPVTQWSQTRNLNTLLVLALIRQESRFQPKIRSSADAVGLMQVIPPTAEFISGELGLKAYDLEDVEDNIKLGTWYFDYTHRNYNDNSMLAIASYNAGPGKVAEWLQKSSTADADEFVEAIPFDETRNYVKAVFENYWNYLRLYNPEIRKQLPS